MFFLFALRVRFVLWMSSSSGSRKTKRRHDGAGGTLHRKVSGGTFKGNDQVLERCTGCTVYGDDAVLIECTGCTVNGDRALVFRSTGCTTTGTECRFIRCEGSDDSGKAARVVETSVRTSGKGSDTVINVGVGIGSQRVAPRAPQPPAAASSSSSSSAKIPMPDIGAAMGLSAIPSGARTVSTVTFGSVSSGRNTIVMRTTADGSAFINGIEVPNGTNLDNGKVFYKGKEVTRESKQVLEEVPAFVVLLDSIASGTTHHEPRQIQIVHANGVRTMYTESGGIQNYF